MFTIMLCKHVHSCKLCQTHGLNCLSMVSTSKVCNIGSIAMEIIVTSCIVYVSSKPVMAVNLVSVMC